MEDKNKTNKTNFQNVLVRIWQTSSQGHISVSSFKSKKHYDLNLEREYAPCDEVDNIVIIVGRRFSKKFLWRHNDVTSTKFGLRIVTISHLPSFNLRPQPQLRL